MALETKTVDYELLVRYSPHPNRGPVGTPITWMHTKAVVVTDTDTGEQISFSTLPPVDLNQAQAEEHLGKKMADYLAGLDAEKAGRKTDSDTHKAALEAKDKEKEDALAAAKTSSDAQVATLQAKLDEQTALVTAKQAEIDALGGTELAQQKAKEKRRDDLVKAKAAAEAELAKLEVSP